MGRGEKTSKTSLKFMVSNLKPKPNWVSQIWAYKAGTKVFPGINLIATRSKNGPALIRRCNLMIKRSVGAPVAASRKYRKDWVVSGSSMRKRYSFRAWACNGRDFRYWIWPAHSI